MPSTTEGLLLAMGGLFLLIGLIGGGFEVSAAKIPAVGAKGRIGSLIAGGLFLALAIRSISGHTQSPAPAQPVTATQSTASVPVQGTQATTAQSTAAPVVQSTATQPTQSAAVQAAESTSSTPVVSTADQHAVVTPPAETAGSATSRPAVNRIPRRITIPIELVAARAPKYYRLQLKVSGLYLDADHCSTKVVMGGRSDFADGGCQLWQLVPAGDGWNRLQLKQGGQFLDAAYCGAQVVLNARSDFADGACQLWKLVPGPGGWSRLQLKHGGQYLDADHCGTKVALNGGSEYDGGSCQPWRLEPQ